MKKLLLCICFFVFVPVAYGQYFASNELEADVEKYVLEHDYQQAIRVLRSVIIENKSSEYQRAHAYYMKAKLFKKIGVYSDAQTNLELSIKHALIQGDNQEVYLWGTIEKALIFAETSQYDQAIIELAKITNLDVSLTNVQQGLVYFLLGLKSREDFKDMTQSMQYFDESLEILTQAHSQYIVVVYREKLKLSAALKQHEQVLYCFEQALKYAVKYQWRSELIDIYREMSCFNPRYPRVF